MPRRRPGVVLVHGWESSRDRTLPHAQVLHALGFHVLTLDVRGHGANPPEVLPMSVGEYAADARAGVAWLRARPEVDRGSASWATRWARAGSPRRDGRRPGASTRSIARRDPRRPVAAHPPDVPARPPADPGAGRLAARLAHDPRVPPAARAHGRVRERDPRGPVDAGARDARPRDRRRRRPAGPPRAPRACPSRRAPGRRSRRRSWCPAGSHSWTVRVPGLSRGARPVPRDRTSAGRSRRMRQPRVAVAVPAASASPGPGADHRRWTTSPAGSAPSARLVR